MDQELISYLDKRFDTMDKRFDTMDERFEAMDERFDTMDKRFEAMDERFDTMDKRFEAMDKRFEAMDERFDAMDKRFEELKQDGNETRILLEGLRRDLQLIAEGLAAGFDEGLKRTRSEHDDEIEEVRTFNRLSYSELHRRMTVLEDWKERLAGSDPIAMVRERFGLKSKQV